MIALVLMGCGDQVTEWETCTPLNLERTLSLGPMELLGEPLPDVWLNRGPGFAVGDFDQDGVDDVFVGPHTGPAQFLSNGDLHPIVVDGKPLLEVTGAAAGDFDGDGVWDLVVSRGRGAQDLILMGMGKGTFSSHPLPDSKGEAKSPSLADIDGDGDLDVLVMGFVPLPDPVAIEKGEQVSDGGRLYRNDGTAWTLVEVPPEMLAGLGYQGTWLDADLDGDADLYVVNDYGSTAVPNGLFLNDGTGGFEQAEECACDLAINGMGGAVGDPNGDGIADIFITDIGRTHLVAGDGVGGFVEVPNAPVPNRKNIGFAWGALWLDLDQDGHDDLITTYGNPRSGKGFDGAEGDAIHLANGDGTFRPLQPERGFASESSTRTPMAADLDHDGRPELIIGGIASLEVWTLAGGCPGAVLLRGLQQGDRVTATLPDGTRSHRWAWFGVTGGSTGHDVWVGLGGAPWVDVVVEGTDGSQHWWPALKP